jgi:hypothetical protein
MDARTSFELPSAFNKVVRELQEAIAIIWSRADAGLRPSLKKDFEVLRGLEQRWQDDNQIRGGIRDCWQKICALSEKCNGKAQTPEDVTTFIFDGLVRSRRIADRASEVVEERPRSKKASQKAFAELGKVLARKMKGVKSLSEQLRVLDPVVDYYSKLKELTSNENETFPGMRKNQDGSRTLRVYCLRLGQGICRATGRWCDQEVAVFAQVALDRTDITADTVKKLRRSTTKEGRQRKKRPILLS